MQQEPGHSVNGKSPRRHRNEQDIFNMMEEYERSEGLSVRDFCELHDISDGTFYNWQKRYRQRNEAAPTQNIASAFTGKPQRIPAASAQSFF